MARNKVQFQRGLSDVEFERLYGTEEKCREALFSWTLEIMPRSPAMISRSMPKPVRTFSICGSSVLGSPVEHRDRHRTPARIRQKPVVDLQRAALAVAAAADPGERAGDY